MNFLGEFIKSRIFRVGFNSIDEFLRANPHIKSATFYRKMKEGFDDAQDRTKELIASALQFSEWRELKHAFTVNDVTMGLTTVDRRTAVKERKQGLKFMSILGQTMPPIFNLSIAAGGWVELEGEGFSLSREQLQAGAFFILIKGDSMAPVWRDGEIVLFHRFDPSPDSDAPNPGDDYLVVDNTGRGTFKRFVRVDDETFVLKAVNPKYKKPLTIARQEIALMAWARGTFADRREG